MNKGFTAPLVIAIGALVVAVVAGVVGYSLKSTAKPQPSPIPATQTFTIPTPTPTDETVYTDPGSANWKTYTSSTGQFSLKYPSEWNVVTGGSIDTGTETISFGPKVTSSSEDTNLKFWVQMQRPDSRTGIVDAKTYADAIAKGYSVSNFKTTNTKLGGVNALRIEYNENIGERLFVVAEQNKLIYSISLKTPFDQGLMKIFNQILSTFKFLD